MPEDRAITSSKSDVDPCSHGRDPDRQKNAGGRTDGFSGHFYLMYNNKYYKQCHVIQSKIKKPKNLTNGQRK